MTEERISYILNVCHGLSKVNFQVISEIMWKEFSIQFHPTKTWGEMGLDDELDQVVLAMALEKKLDIIIDDQVIEDVFGKDVYPVDFVSIIRQRKLEQLIPSST